MLQLEHVSKYYNTSNTIALGLRNVSIELKKGEIVAVVGESGSGKSTFLNVITGIDSYEDGEMFFYDEETSYFNKDDLEKYRKDNVGFIFQNYNLVESYSVLQNVMLPLILRGINRKEAKQKAKEIIQQVGLEKRMNNKGIHLSGGEAQRVSIARAIASDSLILACDEPTGNLDSKTGKEIIKLIEDVSKDRLVVIVTHNFEEVKDIATRKITFHDGEIVEDIVLKEKEIVDQKAETTHYDIKKRDCFKLSISNTLSTPKKTIFASLVFMAVAFIIACLFGTLTVLKAENRVNSAVYANSNKQRVVIYNNDYSSLDKEKIDSSFENNQLVTNAFMEDYGLIFSTNDGEEIDLLLDYRDVSSKKLMEGKMPKKEKDILIGVSKKDKNRYIKYIGKKIDVSSFHFDLEIVGLYEYDSKNDYAMLYTPDESLKKRIIASSLASSQLITGFYTINNKKITDSVYFRYSPTQVGLGYEVPKIVYDEFGNPPLTLVWDGIYEYAIDASKITTSYNPLVGRNMTMITYGDDLLDILQQEYKEVSVWASSDTSTEELKERALQLGYDVAVPSQVNRSISMDLIFYRIISIFFTVIAIAIIISIYFLSYLVLSRIYASKTKDYTIMRTLGIRRQSMGIVVYFEVGLLCVSVSMITLIVLKILSSFFHNGLWIAFKYFEIRNCLLFLIAILFFALLMARRFNRRLFKFSVNTTMKKEVLGND